MSVTIERDMSNNAYKITYVLHEKFEDMQGPMVEAIVQEIKSAIVRHFVDKILKEKSDELWACISIDTIARMAEISAGRQALERAIK